MSTVERTRERTPTGHPPRSSSGASRLARRGWVAMTVLSVLIALVAARYLTFDPDLYFSEQRATYLDHELALGIHVACGALALLVGPFQFVRRLRRWSVRAHRAGGALYLASVTGLGISGLVLAPTAYTGPVASLGFTLLGLATLLTSWTAVGMALAGRYADHRRWMVRSFALVWGGVMLRVWVPVYLVASGVGLVDVTFETAYAAIAWLCWVPNLGLAVWFTRRPVSAAPGS